MPPRASQEAAEAARGTSRPARAPVHRGLPLLAIALLAGIGVSSAFVLSPTRFGSSIPGDDALGTVATATLKANRDYDILDPETTEQRREEAARSVRPVYDYEANAGELLRERIARAFAEGRAAVEEWKRQNAAKAAKVSAALLERTRADGRRRSFPEEAELLRFLESQRDELWKTLQAVVDDDDYLELARSGFDMTAERAASRLAALATVGYAVAERELLAADRERGLVIRALPTGAAPAERLVLDIDRIRDLAQLRVEVDRLAQEQLGDLPPGLRRAVAQLVKRALRPNLAYDDQETRRRQQEKRAQVKVAVVQVKRGDKIIGGGEQVTKMHLRIFRAMRAAGSASAEGQIRLGGGLFAALACAALLVFARRNLRGLRLRTRDLVVLAVALLLQLLLVRGSLAASELLRDLVREHLRGPFASFATEVVSGAIPLTAGSMLVGFLFSSAAALFWTAAFAPICGLMLGGALQPAVAALIGGVVAVDRVARAGSRGAVFRAGLWVAACNVLVLASLWLFQGRFLSAETAAALVGGALSAALLAPLLVLLAAPLLEATLGTVSNVRLLKLANFNHPVLKDLIVQAPGTYHHGIVIGALVEAAAREIGANPLLARVGAYYHDIGKGKNPLWFGENQKGENRHDRIAPAISAEIIKRHVADGVELARAAKLPAPVVDFIVQHHGTRLIGYFFHRAKEEAERSGQSPPSPADYRYDGPKPQTPEAALVMIADMVVATSRNLIEASPEKLRTLIEHAVQAALADGQLDECDVTLRDLEAASRSFVATLQSLYASQPEAEVGPQPGRAALRVLETAATPVPEDASLRIARKP